MDLIQNSAIFGTSAESFQVITDAVYDLWSGPAALCPDSERALRAVRRLITSAAADGGYSPRRALDVGERWVKSIFIHQFMDPGTFDLSRARKCCQVYTQLDGRMIPACIYNCLLRPGGRVPSTAGSTARADAGAEAGAPSDAADESASATLPE
jgi:7,8-dihydro-6-hydroxymethylpterin dimethyltransferase